MKMGTCGIPVEPKLPKLQHKIQQEYLISQEMWGNISWSRVEMKMGICGIPVQSVSNKMVQLENIYIFNVCIHSCGMRYS